MTSPKHVFIIENLEPKLGRWCLIEYENISKLLGPRSLWFTNIKRKNKKLEKLGRVFKQSVRDMKLGSSCILDPEASKLLVPSDSSKFQYFIFGGILGDYPPKKRTKAELTSKIKFKSSARNIGRAQMSTDNAVYTVKKIIEGTEFSKLKFRDKIEIKMNKVLSLQLPYRYNLVRGTPFMSPKLLKFLKRKRGF